MKIKKGYTLSQFVDLQQQIVMSNTAIVQPSDINSENVNEYNDESLWAWGRIKKYNDFLKQTLKMEMFVSKTDANKVIFDGELKGNYFVFPHIRIDINAVFSKYTPYSIGDFFNDFSVAIKLKNVNI